MLTGEPSWAELVLALPRPTTHPGRASSFVWLAGQLNLSLRAEWA